MNKLSVENELNPALNPALNPKSIGQQTYGFKYGSDPMSEAAGALAAFDNSSAKLNALHDRGQMGGKIKTIDRITVPQFDTFNPSGPNGGTSASAALNGNNLELVRQSVWDKSAFSGGRQLMLRRKSRKSRNHRYTKVKKLGKRKKTKGRKTKDRKTKGRKTKGRKTKGRKTKKSRKLN